MKDDGSQQKLVRDEDMKETREVPRGSTVEGGLLQMIVSMWTL